MHKAMVKLAAETSFCSGPALAARPTWAARMSGTDWGSQRSATLSAAAQSCWWHHMSMASRGLPALTNSSSASWKRPESRGHG